jgi:hypothetical protein
VRTAITGRNAKGGLKRQKSSFGFSIRAHDRVGS